MDVACEVAEALSRSDQGSHRDHQEGHRGDQSRPYPRVLTPSARARLGGSYDRQGCEGRGHNSNVYFHEDLEPGQCSQRGEQAEPAPFACCPERCKRQPKGRRERQLGCLEQVGRNGHGGPRHNARGQEPPRLAQGRHDRALPSPR